MKNSIYYSLIVGLILTGCNAGGNQSQNTPTPTNQTFSPKINSTSGRDLFMTFKTSIINNSSQNLNISVPDSDHLTCGSSATSTNNPNCADAWTNTTIQSNSEETFWMHADYSNDAPDQVGTISLSVYANNAPLFGIWQDGQGTPNPQNHYSSQYANNILEITDQEGGYNVDGMNPSVFVGMGDSNGLIESSNFSVDKSGNDILNIVVSNNPTAT